MKCINTPCVCGDGTRSTCVCAFGFFWWLCFNGYRQSTMATTLIMAGRTDGRTEPKLLVYFLLTWSCWVQLSWLGVEYRTGPWHAKPMELCCGVIALPGMMAGMPWRSITDSNCTPVLAVAYHGWLVCGISEWVWVGVGVWWWYDDDDGWWHGDCIFIPMMIWCVVWCGVVVGFVFIANISRYVCLPYSS